MLIELLQHCCHSHGLCWPRMFTRAQRALSELCWPSSMGCERSSLLEVVLGNRIQALKHVFEELCSKKALLRAAVPGLCSSWCLQL